MLKNEKRNHANTGASECRNWRAVAGAGTGEPMAQGELIQELADQWHRAN